MKNAVIGKEAMKQNDTKCFSRNTGLGGKAMKKLLKPTKKAKKAMEDEGMIIYFHQEW